jgi:hypothetical protein
MSRNISALVRIGIAVIVFGWLAIAPAEAQRQHGCFVGRGHTGQPTYLRLVAERYRNSYEIYGTISSAAIGTMRIKADGWSGAGRLFSRHEFEGGALQIRITNYTGTGLSLWVERYGTFGFRRTRC